MNVRASFCLIKVCQSERPEDEKKHYVIHAGQGKPRVISLYTELTSLQKNIILERFDMQNCKSRATTCEQKLNYTNNAELMRDVRKYREAVGSLIYLATCTRPDLRFVVSELSQYFTRPTVEQWNTVKHVLRYLKGTQNKELCYRKGANENLIHAYSDADWAADVTDRRSTTGYCISLNKNGPLVSWKTKRQPTVAPSTVSLSLYLSLSLSLSIYIYLSIICCY